MVALEADDVGGFGFSREPAEDAAEGAGTNVAVPLQQADVVVRMELGGGVDVVHVPT